jgi:CRP-like cAMP-binding protein
METLFENGIRALKDGRYEEALALLAEAVRHKPYDHRARLMAARAMAGLGEKERALTVLLSTAEGLLKRNYLLSAIMAVKLAQQINPEEAPLKEILRRIHARAREIPPSKVDGPPPLPPPPPPEADPEKDLTGLRGAVLVDCAAEALKSDDGGRVADIRRRAPLPLMAELECEAFVDLAMLMALRELTDTQMLVKEGDSGASVFVIIAGQVRVTRQEDPSRHLATLSGGALFGELSVITGAPRSASIFAVGDVELFEVTRADLDHVGKNHPTVPQVMAEFAQRRLAMNLLATAPLFTHLETAHRGPVLQRFRGRIVPAGERIIVEGEPSAGLFLVLSGEFSVTKRDASGELIVLKVLGDGEVLGEISLVSGGPASATVTAVRKSATVFLPRPAYEELVQSYPQIEDFLVQLSQKRLSDNAAAVSPAEVIDAEELIEEP